jgi:cytochrome c553
MAMILKGRYMAAATEIRAKLSLVPRSCFYSTLFNGGFGLGVALALVLISPSVEAVEPPDIDAGKAVAEAQCVGCHGVDGKGAAPGIPNLAAQVDRYLLESLLAYKAGKRRHAALRDMTTQLSNADIRNVVGYYTSLPPLKGIAEETEKVVLSPYEKGEASAAACARCHGDDGNNKTPGTPSLAGQQPLYFVHAVQDYLEGTRSIATMEMLRELNKVDIESLAHYYAAQTPALREAPGFGDPVAGEPLSARCGGCHGAHGVSNDAATPSLAGQDAQYLVDAIKAYRGRVRLHDAMLADNTDEEIENLAAFYAVQESIAAEKRPIRLGELIDKCDRCHGPGVTHPTLAVPKIGGQDKNYLIMALRTYRDGKRGSSMMHSMSFFYSEAIIDSIASAYASRPGK